MTTATDVTYESRTVKTVRGLEARTRTKLEQEGWEFVSQNQGAIRSELTFRRPKPATPWKLIGIGGGVFGLLIVGMLIMGAFEGGEQSDASIQAAPTQTAAQETLVPTQAPSSQTATPLAVPVAVDPVATPITVDELRDKLNSAKMGGMTVGDRFELTGKLVNSEYWMTGAAGEYSVLLEAQGGAQDLMVFIDKKQTASWIDNTNVHMIVEMGEATIDGETTDGWLRAVSAEIVP